MSIVCSAIAEAEYKEEEVINYTNKWNIKV